MNNKLRSKYSILILCNIPVNLVNGIYSALDLWVKDISSNYKFVTDICIYCPISEKKLDNVIEIPSDIKIVTFNKVKSKKELKKLISRYDVIQVNAGHPSWKNRRLFQTIKIAKKLEKIIISNVSSNRAETTIMNAKKKNILKKLKARVVSNSMITSARKINLLSNGVYLTGHGLLKDFSFKHKNIFVGIASWIKSEDIISKKDFQKKIDSLNQRSKLNLCIATRLEPMKGVHLGIEALGQLNKRVKDVPLLTIYGKGDELSYLKELSKKHNIEENVKFLGFVPYGNPFYEAIRNYDIMLFTNLNIEQPRLIFDAISQGLLPLCPDSIPYKALGLDKEILYKQGNAGSLAEIIDKFKNRDILVKYLKDIYILSEKYTIDSMHYERANWINKIIENGNYET